MTTDTNLRCAVCRAPMALADAVPVPDATITLRYHAKLDDCVRGMLARWAQSQPSAHDRAPAPMETRR